MSISVRTASPSTPYVVQSYTGDVRASPVAYSTGEGPRAEGDRQLAQSIGPAPFAHPLSGPDSLFNVPPHSTLGAWLGQLDSALRHPDFTRWMKTHGISPSNVQFDPHKNSVDVLINGQPKRFTLDDDSGFHAVAGPLITAVQVLGFWPPSSGKFLDYATKPYNVVHFHDVLRFYGIDPLAPPTPYKAFTPIDENDALRGEQVLEEQQRVVGDIHDRQNLLDHLTRLLAKLSAPPATPLMLARALGALKISVHSGSTYSQDHPNANHSKVGAAHFIRASGAPVPKTLDALKKMVQTLRNDPLEQARAAREKTRYTNLMRATHQALPRVREAAKKWAEDIMLKLTGTHVDADKIYLNRFGGGGSTAFTITGWEYMNQEPRHSQTLPDALLSNFSEDDWVPGNLDSQSGLYTVGAGQSKKGGYGAHNQFPLLPSALMHESWKTDFQAQITDKLNSFWSDHGENYRTTLKGEFVSRARQELKAFERTSQDARQALPNEQRFTRDDYRLVMKAVSNVPLDENEPLTVDHLKANARVEGAVLTHVLDINGYLANDILRFSAADHKTQILYVPGHQPTFLRFNSNVELDQWVSAQGKRPDTRKALESHFSLRDRQDNGIGFWSDVKSFITGDRQSNIGVDTAIKYLGNGFWSNHKGVVIDKGNVVIHDDIFNVIKDATQQRMASDADVIIKSNSEVTRDTWLNDVTVAAGLIGKFALVGEPIVVGAAVGVGLAEVALGTEKAISGDSQTERKQGASAALDGALNTLFSLGGGAIEEDALQATPRLTVRREVFSDGREAQVIDHELSPTAYTLPRAEGYDLVDGDSVYRLRNAKPDELTNLTSAEHTDPLEGFEAICAAPAKGGRVKRGANDDCFARIIADLPKPAAQMQALEHVRLLPSKPGLFNKARTVVYEKRVHHVVQTDTGARLVPIANAERVVYKQQIRGDLVADPDFGFHSGDAEGALANDTRVVKLNKISNISDDQRHVRGIVVTSGNRQYLVVEADTAEFYYAPLEKTSTGQITFTKCGPFELSLAQGYRQFLALNRGAQALDKPFIALPKLSGAFAQLEKAGYAADDLKALKTQCKDLSKEQQREVVYQLQRAKAIRDPDIALRPRHVPVLEKPADFAQWSAKRKNQFYAEKAKASVEQALTSTGLGPGNQVRSPTDLARADAANMTLEWLRRTANLRAPNAGDLIMKTGAGNCGEMALLSRDIISKSGGMAREWNASDVHTFTVIGGPSGAVSATVDFSEAAWADAWIVDPWVGIACPAAQYTQQLKTTMANWDKAGLKIRSGTKADMRPQDPQWLDALLNKPKEPHGPPLPAEQPIPLIPPPKTAPPTTHVGMGDSVTLNEGNATLSTRSLSDCSALAVLTDWNGTTYQTRTLMHLTGSNLEFGLLDGSTQRVLDRLQASLKNGGRVILVGGVDTQSTQGMATVIGQTFNDKQPLKALLQERSGVSVSIASSSGVTIKADGTFSLIEGTGKGVFTHEMIEQIFERID